MVKSRNLVMIPMVYRSKNIFSSSHPVAPRWPRKSVACRFGPAESLTEPRGFQCGDQRATGFADLAPGELWSLVDLATGVSRISLESMGKVSHHFMVISLDFLMIFMVIETLVKSREIGGFSEGWYRLMVNSLGFFEWPFLEKEAMNQISKHIKKRHVRRGSKD